MRRFQESFLHSIKHSCSYDKMSVDASSHHPPSPSPFFPAQRGMWFWLREHNWRSSVLREIDQRLTIIQIQRSFIEISFLLSLFRLVLIKSINFLSNYKIAMGCYCMGRWFREICWKWFLIKYFLIIFYSFYRVIYTNIYIYTTSNCKY